jgi:transcription-repair coupling factor (superfamily II helicase)
MSRAMLELAGGPRVHRARGIARALARSIVAGGVDHRESARIEAACWQAQDGGGCRMTSQKPTKARTASGTIKKAVRRPAQPVSSDAPMGMIALHVLNQWRRSGPDGLIFICDDEQRAEQFGAILHGFDPASDVMVLPRLDALPFDDVEPSREISGRRASVLRRMAEHREHVLLIATAESLLQRVPAPQKLQRTAMRLTAGQRFDEAAIRQFLIDADYSLDEGVETPGAALFLGQVLEVFPAGALGPIRLDYADGRIVRIHAYDLESQRETDPIDEVTLDAVSEWSAAGDANGPEQTGAAAVATVFDYVPAAWLIADHGVGQRAERWLQRIDEASPDASKAEATRFMSRAEWDARLADANAAVLPESAPFEAVAAFAGAVSPAKSFRGFLAEQQGFGRRIMFTAATIGDLRTMDRRAGGSSELAADWRQAIKPKSANRKALLVDLDRGFVDPGRKLAVIAAADVLGSRASRHDPMAPALRKDIGDTALAPGDAVIHMDRGVAILRDLTTVSAAGVPDAETVRLEFAGKSTVMVPPSELRSIWRYSSDPTAVALDKVDGSSWTGRRAQIEGDIRQAASLIVQCVVERNRSSAPKLIPPVAEYENFAAGFGYSPTADQARAIGDVLGDLASGRPMNRLICGDVGYGKTEVALRAAAATVFSGKQVAIAVPTTVLARQHLETFRKRFRRFGIEVGQLSRFATAAEARATKKALADGSLPIVIGTHALAGKGVGFARLGLLVVDEEQHFGQADKAKLAALADSVHLLTMTATPIPRTLSEVHAGLRPVSAMTTPPLRRIAVKTVVEPCHDATVTAALRREHRRRGQSFFVCPRIEDIAPMQQRLKEIVPELTMMTVHGKMPAAAIDDAMMGFAAGKAHVLLTTNIIESGLDLPRANTVIVWRPDKFGLAQLHQLRGRVGRGSTRAFALFLSDPDAALSDASSKRLDVLRELSRHGAGFAISASDMDLRGGGDLLSQRQSGHVKLLGPELSRHLLDRALQDPGRPVLLDDPRPKLHLDIPGLLPKSYIQDDAVRLQTYARIFKCGGEEELDTVADEMEERFGELPGEARNLIELARIEQDCLRLGILAVDAGPDAVAATLDPAIHGKRPNRIASNRMLHWKDGRLLYRRPSTPAERLAAVRELADLLEAWPPASAERAPVAKTRNETRDKTRTSAGKRASAIFVS